MKTKIFVLVVLSVLIILSCVNKESKINMDNDIISVMKVDPIKYGNDYLVELDFNDKRIKKFGTKKVNAFNLPLSESFISFISMVSNGLYIDIGNALTVFPVDSVEGIWTNIFDITSMFRKEAFIESDRFVIFGMNGVDFESWAFYTGKRFKNGEFPIVLFYPENIKNKKYTLMNSSFDKFLTIQYYLLKSVDFEETMSYKEAVVKSNKMEDEEQQLVDDLYTKYDSIIPVPKYDFYESGISIKELDILIDKINND